MKKRFSILLMTLVLVSCTVQKKQYYNFSYYRYVKKAENPSDIPSAEMKSLIRLASEADTTSLVQLAEKSTPTTKRKEKVKSQSRLDQKRSESVLTRETPTGTLVDKTGTAKSVETRQGKNADGLLYLVASVMGLAILGLASLIRPAVTKITRWAKANPRKTQAIMAGMHPPLLALGVMNGHNLYEMGYYTSDTMMYTFGAATALGFLSTPFIAKPKTIILPKKVNFQRLAFAGLTISSLMMMVGLGNKLEQKYPDSPITKTIQSIDQATYASNTHSIDPTSKKKILQDRKDGGRMSAGGAAVATFFLVLLACAGICLIIGGIAGAFATAGASIAAIIGGLGILWLSILGIRKVSQRRRETIEREKTQGM